MAIQFQVRPVVILILMACCFVASCALTGSTGCIFPLSLALWVSFVEWMDGCRLSSTLSFDRSVCFNASLRSVSQFGDFCDFKNFFFTLVVNPEFDISLVSLLLFARLGLLHSESLSVPMVCLLLLLRSVIPSLRSIRKFKVAHLFFVPFILWESFLGSCAPLLALVGFRSNGSLAYASC